MIDFTQAFDSMQDIIMVLFSSTSNPIFYNVQELPQFIGIASEGIYPAYIAKLVVTMATHCSDNNCCHGNPWNDEQTLIIIELFITDINIRQKMHHFGTNAVK